MLNSSAVDKVLAGIWETQFSMGLLLSMSVPQFPHQYNGENSTALVYKRGGRLKVYGAQVFCNNVHMMCRSR